MKKGLTLKKEEHMIPVLVIVILAFLGLTLIVSSILIKPIGINDFLKEFLKELGIVILAVFTVSLIYELIIAKRYFSNFLQLLRHQIEQGESNGALCENIGIKEIFKTRDNFESVYPLDKTLSGVTTDSKIQIIAVSMFFIMNKSDLLKDAISKGGNFEFAIYDPKSSNKNYEEIQDLQISDIQSTINVFKKEIVDWITKTPPLGKVELRYHNFTLFDSFSTFDILPNKFGIWDSSFGRSTTRKRTFIIDLNKPLGRDLKQRYTRIWERSNQMFFYDGKQIVKNVL